MDKETLSNYGWIVICVLVLAVMLALATPFGTFVADAVKSTTQGLFDTNQKALDAANIPLDNIGFENGSNNVVTESLNHSGIIPKNGVYISGSEVYTDSVNFPSSVGYSDKYVYGDYVYTYDSTKSGWKVAPANKTKSEYGKILESINGKPVVSMVSAFKNCENLVVAPEIPNSVKYMDYAFDNCKNLEKVINLPEGIETMGRTFAECGKLTSVPELPSSVTELSSTFIHCGSLSGTITINSTPTKYPSCFSGVDMSKIALAGSCDASIKQAIANTGKNSGQVTIID